MAVNEVRTYRFARNVPEEALLGLSPSDLAAAGRLSPRARTREVAVEAMGDDFVQLGGEWFDGPWLSTCLKDVRRAWVFLADAGTDEPFPAPLLPLAEEAAYFAAERLAAAAPAAPGERAYAVAPGGSPGWPEADREKLLRLLGVSGAVLPAASIAGLLFTAPFSADACGSCGGGDGCGGDCGACGGHCHATNGNA